MKSPKTVPRKKRSRLPEAQENLSATSQAPYGQSLTSELRSTVATRTAL